MQALTFRSTHFDIVDRNGQPWLQARQIGSALGYAREDAINKIYERNADEFTSDMTSNVKLTLKGQHRDVRIFSLRGAHLLAMFARTPVAKEFRKWVLDVLDKEVAGQNQQPVTRAEDLAQLMRHQRFLVNYNDGQLTSIVPVGSEACVIDPNNECSVLTFFREFLPSETKLKVTELGFRQLATLAGKQIASWK